MKKVLRIFCRSELALPTAFEKAKAEVTMMPETDVRWGGTSTIQSVIGELAARGAAAGRVGVVGPLPIGPAKALAAMKASPYGADAAIIGDIEEGKGKVYVKTSFGATRVMDMLVGEQLPRIC